MESRLIWSWQAAGSAPADAIVTWRRDAVMHAGGFADGREDAVLDLMRRVEAAEKERRGAGCAHRPEIIATRAPRVQRAMNTAVRRRRAAGTAGCACSPNRRVVRFAVVELHCRQRVPCSCCPPWPAPRCPGGQDGAARRPVPPGVRAGDDDECGAPHAGGCAWQSQTAPNRPPGPRRTARAVRLSASSHRVSARVTVRARSTRSALTRCSRAAAAGSPPTASGRRACRWWTCSSGCSAGADPRPPS